MIRIGAVADVHFHARANGRLRPHLDAVRDDIDVLLIGGDLTCLGTVAEADALATELAGFGRPMVAVLGNHDCHGDAELAIAGAMARAGVQVLEGQATAVDVDGVRIAVAGVKGFGGGFAGASGTEFGERLMKEFVAHTREVATRLREALLAAAADVRVALLHYAPVADTLDGERPEIYPFLGSHLLGDAVDEAGADLILHGHAHAGVEEGVTPGGIPVRNVAQPLLGRPVAIYGVAPGELRTLA